ncbi:hypothetical protein M422DRAFT_34404 [Sphaerobolus stellatus SS14]|uniref:Uncharacterized protein n=1 Tax=Sphaerobolus stellatus (strain SS14) TaxID=990650 RepID=A0A0C9VFH4_SPHS4|nr:hypothetical protein M422DRAFT_34404 [Sphaerobolus stellatus SS14]
MPPVQTPPKRHQCLYGMKRTHRNMSAKIALPNASLSDPSSCSQTASSTQSHLLVTGATSEHPQTRFRGTNAGGWNAHVTRRIVRFVEEVSVRSW